MPGLVHTTIFRYSGQVRSPRMLLELLGHLAMDIDIEIDHYVVSHEQTYPHLRAETVASIEPHRSPS